MKLYCQLNFHNGRHIGATMGQAFVIIVVTLTLNSVSVFADMLSLTKDVRFCPSWAEAHERTLASLNNGSPPYPVKWKGCILLKRGTRVDVIGRDNSFTEIIFSGKHWFADE